MTWVAVDWGTTHLRAWVHAAQGVTALSSNAGMGALEPDQFQDALLALIEPHIDVNSTSIVVCCGMVGARQGWQEARYASVPAAPPDGTGAIRVKTTDPRIDVRILAGMSQQQPADVMRGEETQVAGFIAANPQWDGIICLPGTHAKWVHVSAGEIVSFQTFMTGELFALLASQSVLRHSVETVEWDDLAFDTAVSDAISRPERAFAGLFALRASSLLDELPAGTARAQLSGALIGIELAAARHYWLGQNVALIGEGVLSSHYARALELQGVDAPRIDATEMTLQGLRAAHAALKEQ